MYEYISHTGIDSKSFSRASNPNELVGINSSANYHGTVDQVPPLTDLISMSGRQPVEALDFDYCSSSTLPDEPVHLIQVESEVESRVHPLTLYFSQSFRWK